MSTFQTMIVVGLVFQEQESENLIEKLFIGRVY